MTLDEFQNECMRTAQYPGRGTREGLLYTVLGLASEAGEVAGKLKKLLRDDEAGLKAVYDDPVAAAAVVSEVSDVLWYCVAVLDELDVDADAAAEELLSKLAGRKARGVIGGSGDER